MPPQYRRSQQPKSSMRANTAMTADFLTTSQAAQRLGISVGQFYEWLRMSNDGELAIAGHPATIEYFQGGPRGQGRIRIAVAEVERLIELTRVRPRSGPARRPPVRQASFPGITVKLGRPEQR